MHLAIDKLLSISSGPIRDPVAGASFLDRWGSLGRELAELLRRKNGVYAFESALQVRPLQSEVPPLGLVEWNAPELWKGEYIDDLDSVLFFAEDIFGCQFCIRGDQICSFDPETAFFEPMSYTDDPVAVCCFFLRRSAPYIQTHFAGNDLALCISEAYVIRNSIEPTFVRVAAIETACVTSHDTHLA